MSNTGSTIQDTESEGLLSGTLFASEGKNKDDSFEIIERKGIENSPFVIIGNKERGYFMTIGKYRITTSYPTMEEVEQRLEIEPWNIMLKTLSCMLEYKDEIAEKK